MGISAQEEMWLDVSPPEYALERDGISLVSIGKILQSLEGCACAMGVLNCEFLRKLGLKSGEVAIVDMEAGAEHFGRGIGTSVDSMLVVVEPSLESVGLAVKTKSLAAGAAVNNTWAVLNKVTSEEIALRLKGELRKRGVAVIGLVHYDLEIFEACLEGCRLERGRTGHEIREVVGRLLLS